MSHPFGDQLSQYLHRKHGLSQSKLAAGILQAPAIITDMCKGKRLTGRQARERVLVIVEWLRQQGVLGQVGLRIAQQTGTPGQIASAHERFGRFAQKQGKPIEALRHYQAGLRIVQPFGHRLFMAPCLLLMTTLANMPTAPLDSDQAARLMGAATAILPLEHMLIEQIDLPDIQHSIAHIRTRLDEPTVAAAWAEGQAMTLDEAIAYALALDIIPPNREILC